MKVTSIDIMPIEYVAMKAARIIISAVRIDEICQLPIHTDCKTRLALSLRMPF